MLDTNVQESTTSTGVGPFTLGGSSEDGKTFFSQYGLNIDFECSIDNGSGDRETVWAYLSDQTTLNIVSVISSSNSGNLVNFGAGEKQVFVSATATNIIRTHRGINTVFGYLPWMTPSNLIQNNATRTLQANQLIFIPAWFVRAFNANTLGVKISAGAGDSSNTMLIGAYSTHPETEMPHRLLTGSASFDPSVAGNISRTIADIEIDAGGWYFLAIWCDTTPTLRACNAQFGSVPHPFNSGTFDGSNLCFYRLDGQTGLTELPQTPTGLAPVINSPSPIVYPGRS